MTTTKLKKYRTKQLAKSKLVNRLVTLGLILIMVLISIPKMALAQLFDGGEQQKVSGVPNATIKLPNTEYTESTVDLRVKVLGGEVKLNRTWVNGRWYINPAWSNLRFVLDPLDSSVRTIDRAGTLYQRTGDANLYSVNQVYIKKTTDGWQWYDRQGNWINYDNDGRLIEYGDRNNVKVSFILDSEGRRAAIKDHHGELVYNFTYDASERLTQVEDREGRTVSYEWTGDRLTKVTDVLGYEWLYGYDNNGQLNQKTEPDGGIIKIAYTDSVAAPKTAMNSGKDKQQSESGVVSTTAKDKDTKLARVGKITDKTGAVTVYNSQYNRTNKQYTITVDDPVGKKMVNVYDANGKIVSKSINGYIKETYIRDDKNHIVKYKDQRGIITTTQYNQLNQPIKITYPNGAFESYEYDSSNNKITRFVDKHGNITLWNYDNLGNLVETVEASGKPEQRVIRQKYDNFGQLISLAYGESNDSSIFYQDHDKYGNIVTFIDGNNKKYNYNYNIEGQVINITNPLNATWKIDYNLAGYPLRTVNPLGNITKYNVDALGRVTESIDPLGHKTSYSYQFNTDGWEIKKINSLGHELKYYYDTLGRFVKAISPSGLEAKQSYDSNGRLKEQVDPAGNKVSLNYGEEGSDLSGLIIKALYPTYSLSYQYNVLGQPTKVIQESGSDLISHNIRYDELGYPVSIIQPNDNIITYYRNALGKVTKIEQSLGQETKKDWDVMGNLLSVSDVKGSQYFLTYDKEGNLIEETNFNNKINYTYDAANQLIQRKDSVGNIKNYEYDLAGNKVKETYTKFGEEKPSQTISYCYDAADQLIRVNQTGSIDIISIFTRDKLGRIIKEEITYRNDSASFNKTLQYSYDSDGNISSMTYPDNSTILYNYENGRIKNIILPNKEIIVWEDYKWLKPSQITFPGAVQSFVYDDLQRPLNIKVTAQSGLVLMDHNYKYDKMGNVIQLNNEKGSIEYNYDLSNRLIMANPSHELQQKGLPIEGYSYDVADNRVGSSHQSGSWIYNEENQLTSWGEGAEQTKIDYNLNGNIVTETVNGKVQSYIYNEADRLVTILNGEKELVSYQYDFEGRRISKRVNGETSYFLYTSEGLVGEFDQQGNFKVAYGWQPGAGWGMKPLWQANVQKNGTLKEADYNYLYTDYLGTPVLAANSQGIKTWSSVSEAFGRVILDSENKITMNLRFPGQYYDEETGSHYNYFRDYNPIIGRYYQQDPLGLLGDKNGYAYVGCNPLAYIDPLGLKYPSTHNKCIELRTKYERTRNEYTTKVKELYLDKGKLPVKHTGGRYAESREGHLIIITALYKTLQDRIEQYEKSCEDPPNLPPPPPVLSDCGELTPALPPEEPEESEDESYSATTVTTAVVGGGVVIYIIYRGGRLIPSLLPPLWWSLPANIVTP